jgi:hypothetical protein
MVVADTHDFGVGTARAISNFRYYFTGRPFYLHTVLIV